MARISLEEMEAYVNTWNAERRRLGWKKLYYIKHYPNHGDIPGNEHWEVRETF